MSFIKDNKGFYVSSHLSTIELQHGFGTKKTGDGRNNATLKSISSTSIIISPKQRHTTNIAIVSSENYDINDREIDGVITQNSNLLLTVITADCVPIIFYDPFLKIKGISHQGWRGTLNRLPEKIIDSMISLGSSPRNIHIAIGPCINDCCYQVSKDLADRFQSEFNEAVISRMGSMHLNLLKTNYLMLISGGIPQNNIDFSPFCTSCQKEEFWSFRRDHGIKGEMVSFV